MLDAHIDTALGKKLTEACVSKSRIVIRILIRFAICLFFSLALAGAAKGSRMAGGNAGPQTVLGTVLLTATAILFILFPLRHRKDYIQFFEQGICYNGKAWTFDQLAPIHWSYTEIPVLGDRITLVTRQKALKVTYLKDVMKQYNLAYMKQPERGRNLSCQVK